MFFKYDDFSVRYTGRFGEYAVENRLGEQSVSMTATACGAYFEIAFKGDYIILHFEDKDLAAPRPDLWLQVDSSPRFEVPVSAVIRVDGLSGGEHILKAVFKSAKGNAERYTLPLTSKMSFKGYEAKENSVLPEDNRKTIELVGDSITEGCGLDHSNLREGRGMHDDIAPALNDSLATYAYKMVEHYNLRPVFAAYGGVGVGITWSHDVPVAKECYPYCFEGAPVKYGHPDYILLSYGTNDWGNMTDEKFIADYTEFLTILRNTHKQSTIICVTPFKGWYKEQISKIIKDFNDNKVYCVENEWGKDYDLHPTREEHAIMGEKLIEAVKDIIK